MNFRELTDLIRPYTLSGTLEDLTEAKRLLDEYADDFTGKERERIAQESARLMGEMDDLMPNLSFIDDDMEEKDDDEIITVMVPGRKNK
jgi:hypothetical protein